MTYDLQQIYKYSAILSYMHLYYSSFQAMSQENIFLDNYETSQIFQVDEHLFGSDEQIYPFDQGQNGSAQQKQSYFTFNDKKQKLKDSQTAQAKRLTITPGNKLNDGQKEAIEKTLAEKFITIGFGYIINMKAVKKRHGIAINASYYNNTMSSIVRKTFRTLQNQLLNQCKQENIKRISHSQGSLLRSPMLQCTKWMKKDELDTFYKFICRTYDLKKVYISEDQASRLYGQIIQSAHKGHEVSHIILHRTKKKNDIKNSQGLVFSYAPSSTIAKNVTNNQGVSILNKFIQH